MTLNTVIAKEIPGFDGDPSYPIPTNENKGPKKAAIPNDKVTFIGRLWKYRYYSMDQIVEKMLELIL